MSTKEIDTARRRKFLEWPRDMYMVLDEFLEESLPSHRAMAIAVPKEGG